MTNYVPYQKCPICEGGGVIKPGEIDEKGCPTCRGERIIPMHLIQERLQAGSYQAEQLKSMFHPYNQSEETGK